MTKLLLSTTNCLLIMTFLSGRLVQVGSALGTSLEPTTKLVKNNNSQMKMETSVEEALKANDITSGSNLNSNNKSNTNKTNIINRQISSQASKQMVGNKVRQGLLEAASEIGVLTQIPQSSGGNQREREKEKEQSSSASKRGDNSTTTMSLLSNSNVIQDQTSVSNGNNNQLKGPTQLKGATQLKGISRVRQHQDYKLPSWFNYAIYKHFYGKRYSDKRENELRKRIYLRTALKVFKQRALYRAGRVSSLASVNELSDLVSKSELH